MSNTQGGQFTLNLDRFLKKVQSDSDQVVRYIALTALKKVVKKSPVDTGRFRGNWQVGVGKLSSSTVDKVDKIGATTIADGMGKINAFKAGQTIFIYNNMPYARVLEYGLYPNPAKRGSWDKKEKAYVIKTIGGYSRQAPEGMVRITLREISTTLALIVRTMRK